MILDRIDQAFAAIERVGSSIARRKWLAATLCGLLVLAVRVAELPRMKVPLPYLRDEFSFFLAAETFASGRLTNPQHPMWKHFESMHILQSPTYMSMYPPAQGMFMAVGEKLAGNPWIGVLLSMSLCCAALCWMLQGWLPPGWAFLGGLLIATRIGIFTYWMNTYYGGGVAALGGALMFGALPRILRRARLRDAVLLSLGVAILMNSRPYEGLIAAIPVAGALLYWLFRGLGPARSRWLRVGCPAVTMIAVSFAFVGYYNWRVTGNPLLLPQTLNRQTYAVAPYLAWESPRPEPVYRDETMRKFYTVWEGRFQLADEQDTLEGWLASARVRFPPVWFFYLGNVLSVPMILLPLSFRDRRMRFWAWATPVFLVGLVLARFTQAHYVAPMAAGLYVFLMQSMRHLRHLNLAVKDAGLWAVRLIVIFAAAGFLNKVFVGQTGVDQSLYRRFDRAQLENRLEKTEGRHLVIVRYGDQEILGQEWVYNHADIDGSRIVWAREMMDPSDNIDLQAYFHDRSCWIFEPDADQTKLTPCAPLRAP